MQMTNYFILYFTCMAFLTSCQVSNRLITHPYVYIQHERREAKNGN